MEKGIFVWFGYPIPIQERFRMIQDAGFTAVLLNWEDKNPEYNGTKEERIQLAKQLGLKIESIHLPFDGCNVLWQAIKDGDAYEERLMRQIHECAIFGPCTVVMHLTNGFTMPIASPVIIERVKRMASYAKQHDVKIALENLKIIPALDYVLRHVTDENVGFCYDSGHHHLYAPEDDLLGRYANRLFAIHLHDNAGDKDMHMLPYDGTVDWAYVRKGLINSCYQGAMTLELEASKWPAYQKLSAEEYLKEAYIRLVKAFD